MNKHVDGWIHSICGYIVYVDTQNMWTHRMDGYMEYVDMEGIYKNKRKNLKSSQLGEDMTIITK